jgi:hypothetical protein
MLMRQSLPDIVETMKNILTSFATNFLIMQLIDARKKRGQRNYERQRFELSYYIYYFILDSLPHDKNGSL